MLIDWFTVAAQALNFVILVFLLKRFLYKPVLAAIDTREKKIAAELGDAAAKQAEAKKEREAFEHKNENLEQQRAALLKTATEEAATERRRLLDEARKAADALSEKRMARLRSDADELRQAIRRRTQDEVFAVARKALSDLADTTLEERVSDVFRGRLRAMDAQAKATMAEAIKAASAPVQVRSAFELPAAQRAAIQDAVNRAFSADVPIRFETAAGLVSGIELEVGGHKLGWSIAEYLGSLERAVVELLKQGKQETGANAEPPPDATTKPGARADKRPGAAEPSLPAQPELKPEANREGKAEAARETTSA